MRNDRDVRIGRKATSTHKVCLRQTISDPTSLLVHRRLPRLTMTPSTPSPSHLDCLVQKGIKFFTPDAQKPALSNARIHIALHQAGVDAADPTRGVSLETVQASSDADTM